MLERGITMLMLSEMAAIPYQTLARCFKRQREFTSHEMKRIAAAMGFIIEDIPYYMLGGRKVAELRKGD